MLKKEMTREQDGEEYVHLYNTLRRHYGKDLQLFRKLEDTILFKVRGKNVIISFCPNHFLLLQSASKEKEILNEIASLLRQYMTNKEPLCRYDFQSEGGQDFHSMIEWNLTNPEKRLSEIQSGQGYYAGIQNLQIYSQEIKEENKEKQKVK